MDKLSFSYHKAIEAAIQASHVIMHYYEKGFNSNFKSDGSPVTEADLASSKIIHEILDVTQIPILGEESVHQSYEIRKEWILNWCVDPLDGTKEYIKRNGEFAVNIALIENSEAIFGVIACPVEKNLIFGGKDIGVFMLSFEHFPSFEKYEKIETKADFNVPLVMASSRTPHSGASQDFITKLKSEHPEIEFLKKGSALKFFDLALGNADIYPRFAPTMEWDIAAGHAILEALGGTVLNVETNQPLTYNKENLFNPHFIAKTKPLLILIFIFSWLFSSFGQHNLIPIHSYFKDKIYSPLKGGTYVGNSFFPIAESEYDLNKLNADTSIQYYDLTEIALKHYLAEVKGPNFNFSITPLLDLSRGKDYDEKANTLYYQNTRGLQIEGDLLKSFSFSTAFYENQARFTTYERLYYLSVGELYPNLNQTYSSTNAVIPGGARTKPFKIQGFDYAYALGNIVFKPIKQLQISYGNNAHFIGAGYRSLLLSDNSVGTPYLQFNYFISKKWSFVYLREKMLNLKRRPIKTTDEAYYQPKGFSVNYLTFKPTQFFTASLFEGTMWNKGDSVTTHPVNSLFYNPVPLLNQTINSNQKQLSSVIGINLEGVIQKQFRIYAQLAVSNLNFKHPGFQLGVRAYNLFKIKDLMLQMEFNQVPAALYVNPSNRNLNYSHYNLPIAAIKGSGFQEFVIRGNYEYQRWYIDYKTVMYQLMDFQPNNLLAVSNTLPIQNQQIYHTQIEVGYRINRLINWTTFLNWTKRTDFNNPQLNCSLLTLGFRTSLINHYSDF